MRRTFSYTSRAIDNPIGIPASDNFDGSGHNSGVAGDSNWTERGWSGSVEQGGIMPHIVNSKLRLDIGDGGQASVLENDSIDHSGDFTAEITGLSMSHPASWYYWFNFRVRVGGNSYYVGFNSIPFHPIAGHYFQYPSGFTYVPSGLESPTYKFVRIGNTLRAYYGNAKIGAGKTVSGNLTNLLPYSVSDTDAMTCAFGAISVVDGAGKLIYISP